MKSIYKILFTLLMFFAAASIIYSCKKDAAPTPVINYIRVTNPVSSDSLLVSANQGQLIAIVGTNLQEAREVWFNDQQSRLTPTYISGNSILVSVPSKIPTTVNNIMTIVFANGYKLKYNFSVDISKPSLNSMTCEFVNAGDVATIIGNYFYQPLTVTFTGGATGEIVSVADGVLKFKVPANAQPGPITVKTNFGITSSDFWFRDPRNQFITSDPYEGWHEENLVVTNPGPGDPPKISGNYIRVNKKLASWSWNEIADGPASAMPNHSKKIPDDAILHPEKYYLKFEICTMKPYNNGMIRINAGTSVQDAVNYQWAPPYDSKGQWQTVVISYDEVWKSYTVKPTVNPDGYWAMLLMQGPGDLDADISFDSFRIVPKSNK
ncbi:glycan-binding surface protein [Pinibacter soli]|uniref:Glycan-binding surface protein n=1 Tax=Pinibacter soli TaxID=3044211 RepID=A0ABT6RHI0_9BACT|nr:glycan-binding surface protein [Pinibacter soli]MDI3322015.1 glycan-binding surface protein [Pinibacter soli]